MGYGWLQGPEGDPGTGGKVPAQDTMSGGINCWSGPFFVICVSLLCIKMAFALPFLALLLHYRQGLTQHQCTALQFYVLNTFLEWSKLSIWNDGGVCGESLKSAASKLPQFPSQTPTEIGLIGF